MSTAAGDSGKNLGVLYTGYLDKRNPVTGSYKQRFVVLTLDALHWFKRSEGYDLFGEERGQVQLVNMLTTRILDEDISTFEIQGTDTKKRLFRASSEVDCEEWVSAIRSAIKLLTNSNVKRGFNRRTSLAGIRNFDLEDIEEPAENQEVTVLLMSLNCPSKQTEVVVARKPEWNRIVSVPKVHALDEILISISNGGIVRLSYETLLQKAEDGREFDATVQNVTLASSLRMHVSIERDVLTGAAKSGDYTENVTDSKNKKLVQKMFELVLAIINQRSTAINLMLALMVVLAGLFSLSAVGINTSLLFLFAFLLALYNFNQILDDLHAGENQKQTSSMRVILHGHNFTSPDAPVNTAEEDIIPKRFIDGCEGDMKEARRRWDITRHWRETEGVNTVLEEPQPHFHLIKSMYPHYHCSTGKQGHVVFWERPGEFQGAQLAARGVGTEELVRHWLFTTEYQWQVMCDKDETAKSIAVLDVKGIGMGDLAGSNLDYIKKTLGIANMHYPERSFVIYIINAPFYASMMWKLVKPMVHPNTQKKVRILGGNDAYKGLLEHLDHDQIPEYYGGGLDFGGHDSCRFNSPQTLALNEYVRQLNERHQTGGAAGDNTNITNVPFSNTEGGGSARQHPLGDEHAPPGRPGDVPASLSANFSSVEGLLSGNNGNNNNNSTGYDDRANTAGDELVGADSQHQPMTPASSKMFRRQSSMDKRYQGGHPSMVNTNGTLAATAAHVDGGAMSPGGDGISVLTAPTDMDDWSIASVTTAGPVQGRN